LARLQGFEIDPDLGVAAATASYRRNLAIAGWSANLVGKVDFGASRWMRLWQHPRNCSMKWLQPIPIRFHWSDFWHEPSAWLFKLFALVCIPRRDQSRFIFCPFETEMVRSGPERYRRTARDFQAFPNWRAMETI